MIAGRKVVEVAGHLYVEPPKNRKKRATVYPRRTPGGYPSPASSPTASSRPAPSSKSAPTPSAWSSPPRAAGTGGRPYRIRYRPGILAVRRYGSSARNGWWWYPDSSHHSRRAEPAPGALRHHWCLCRHCAAGPDTSDKTHRPDAGGKLGEPGPALFGAEGTRCANPNRGGAGRAALQP